MGGVVAVRRGVVDRPEVGRDLLPESRGFRRRDGPLGVGVGGIEVDDVLVRAVGDRLGPVDPGRVEPLAALVGRRDDALERLEHGLGEALPDVVQAERPLGADEPFAGDAGGPHDRPGVDARVVGHAKIAPFAEPLVDVEVPVAGRRVAVVAQDDRIDAVGTLVEQLSERSVLLDVQIAESVFVAPEVVTGDIRRHEYAEEDVDCGFADEGLERALVVPQSVGDIR